MPEIILASKSLARRTLLENAAVQFRCVDSHVDEDAIKQECRAAGNNLEETAMLLALAKARSVGARHPDAYVIGADQILELDGAGFDKAKTMAEARERLQQFAGRTHTLLTAVAVVRHGETVWSAAQSPELEMYQLTDPEIDSYLHQAGERVLGAVGVYQLEGAGIQLFRRVSGDYFAILGLPLVPLLAFLRGENLLSFGH